jgi:hypothetical protein
MLFLVIIWLIALGLFIILALMCAFACVIGCMGNPDERFNKQEHEENFMDPPESNGPFTMEKVQNLPPGKWDIELNRLRAEQQRKFENSIKLLDQWFDSVFRAFMYTCFIGSITYVVSLI